MVGDITDWENQYSMYSNDQVPHYYTWILLPEGWTQQWVEGAQLPKRVLSKYHASLTSIAATRGKRVAQPSGIIVDSNEERMAEDYAEDEHDDNEEEEVIEEPEDEDDKDFIVPDEGMEEEEEAEEEEVQEGEEEDAPALSISD